MIRLGGHSIILIDLYLSVMTYWEPRREWFEEHSPKIIRAVNRFQATKEFKVVSDNNSL